MKKISIKITLLILFAITISSCKKEKTTGSGSSNIAFFEPNKTMVYANLADRNYSFDLDNKGTADLSFTVDFADTKQMAIIYLPDDPMNGFVKDTIINLISFAKSLNKDVSVDYTSEYILGVDGTAMYYKSYPINRGIAGQGDKYFGFKIKLEGRLYFGWVLVNLDNITGNLQIKQIAYNKTANTPIKTGEK